jgi:hypothetical protein
MEFEKEKPEHGREGFKPIFTVKDSGVYKYVGAGLKPAQKRVIPALSRNPGSPLPKAELPLDEGGILHTPTMGP